MKKRYRTAANAENIRNKRCFHCCVTSVGCVYHSHPALVLRYAPSHVPQPKEASLPQLATSALAYLLTRVPVASLPLLLCAFFAASLLSRRSYFLRTRRVSPMSRVLTWSSTRDRTPHLKRHRRDDRRQGGLRFRLRQPRGRRIRR